MYQVWAQNSWDIADEKWHAILGPGMLLSETQLFVVVRMKIVKYFQSVSGSEICEIKFHSFSLFQTLIPQIGRSYLSSWSPRSRKSRQCWTRRRCCCPRYTRPPPGPAPWPASPPLTTRAPAAPGRGTPSQCQDPGPSQSGWGIRWQTVDFRVSEFDRGFTENFFTGWHREAREKQQYRQ